MIGDDDDVKEIKTLDTRITTCMQKIEGKNNLHCQLKGHLL